MEVQFPRALPALVDLSYWSRSVFYRVKPDSPAYMIQACAQHSPNKLRSPIPIDWSAKSEKTVLTEVSLP